MEVQLTDSRMVQALYLAIVSLLVFLYVYVRRLEVRMSMLDAALDTLLAEPAPSDFLPGVEDRLRSLEATGPTEPAGEAPPPSGDCRDGTCDLVESAETKTEAEAEAEAEIEGETEGEIRKKAVERHILAALMKGLAVTED
jgi:hypothetical protein